MVNYIDNGIKVPDTKIVAILFSEANFTGNPEKIRTYNVDTHKFHNLSIYKSIKVKKQATHQPNAKLKTFLRNI